MKKNVRHTIGVLSIAFFAIAIWGSSPTSYLVTFAAKDPDIFTKASLKDYVRKNNSPTIVVRVAGDASREVLSNTKQGTIYNTIEKELGRAGFVVRDRALFQKVLDEKVSDYSKISSTTNTDLILELVAYETEKYETNKYYQNDVQKVSPNHKFIFDGIKVEFKLIKVKENDIVGSYTFHYAPCKDGCLYTPSSESGIFSNPRPASKTGLEENVNEIFFKDCTQRLIKEMKGDVESNSNTNISTNQNQEVTQKKETTNEIKIGDIVSWTDDFKKPWLGTVFQIDMDIASVKISDSNVTKKVKLTKLTILK